MGYSGYLLVAYFSLCLLPFNTHYITCLLNFYSALLHCCHEDFVAQIIVNHLKINYYHKDKNIGTEMPEKAV